MSEQKQTNNVPFYKKASFAYGIITVMIALLVGMISGWNLRGDAETHTKAAAKEMVTTLSPKAQK